MDVLESVTIVGAGVMGRGIAAVAAGTGATVVLVDADGGQREAAVPAVTTSLRAGVERGKVDPDAAERGLARLEVTADLEAACRDTDLVVEAVVEQLDVKADVLAAAEGSAPAGAPLATNTSALSVTEIAAVLDDPGRCVGMHFFNPVEKMRLVEVVRGLATRDATVDAVVAAARTLGKETVVVADVPGFATSRLNALIGNEGMRMLEEGVAGPEDVDRAVRLGLNHPLGPLEMGDLVGWDTRLRVLEHLQATLGDRFRPTTLHRRLVAAGRLGRKVGRGVYRYDETGARIDEPSDLG